MTALSIHGVAAAPRHHTRKVSVARKSQAFFQALGAPAFRYMPARIIIMNSNNNNNNVDRDVMEGTRATSGNEENVPQEERPAVTATPGLAKGQGTAIVTGVISILFGIAYLALVQVMDMRGGELQPPPPEAFMN